MWIPERQPRASKQKWFDFAVISFITGVSLHTTDGERKIIIQWNVHFQHFPFTNALENKMACSNMLS